MGSHIVNGQFQSDKYPSCPAGKVPLSVKDPSAQPLLWVYAQFHRSIDAEFSSDLEAALLAAGYVHVAQDNEISKAECARLISAMREDDERMSEAPWSAMPFGSMAPNDYEINGPDMPCNLVTMNDALGIARTRNNLCDIADRFESTLRDLETWKSGAVTFQAAHAATELRDADKYIDRFHSQCAASERDAFSIRAQLRDTADTLDVVRVASIERGTECDSLRRQLTAEQQRTAELVSDLEQMRTLVQALRFDIEERVRLGAEVDRLTAKESVLNGPLQELIDMALEWPVLREQLEAAQLGYGTLTARYESEEKSRQEAVSMLGQANRRIDTLQALLKSNAEVYVATERAHAADRELLAAMTRDRDEIQRAARELGAVKVYRTPEVIADGPWAGCEVLGGAGSAKVQRDVLGAVLDSNDKLEEECDTLRAEVDRLRADAAYSKPTAEDPIGKAPRCHQDPSRETPHCAVHDDPPDWHSEVRGYVGPSGWVCNSGGMAFDAKLGEVAMVAYNKAADLSQEAHGSTALADLAAAQRRIAELEADRIAAAKAYESREDVLRIVWPVYQDVLHWYEYRHEERGRVCLSMLREDFLDSRRSLTRELIVALKAIGLE